ncbi:DgyrCDS13584 [Dimorphilus gyrociliatus]|uniref:Phospholipase B1, membrane-associated n=1 Tax=Dimorphilus gyrociliatus TaxID=2664684 RepID=A0A7I8WB22_9ANNE|nr:DgyrCDS13584 [Dimorphilus gyrociliatus]
MKSLILLGFFGCLYFASARLTTEEVEWLDFAIQHQNNASFQTLWKKKVKSYKEATVDIPEFKCNVGPIGDKPTSVHKLKPGDINVVAAFGDSITAGNGADADNLLEVILNARGHSWSIGGMESLEKILTIPNILKKFNPNLKGYSTDTSDEDDPEAGMNVARMGARATHLPNQADKMIDRLKTTSDIDFENDWKLITLFIGGNDLCGYCRDRPNRSPEKFAEHIKNTLDKLHQQVPKALVQVVSMFDVTPVRHLSADWICDLLQERFCSCARNSDTRPELRPVQLGYHLRVDELISSGRYDTRDDFTVVVQPHMRDLVPPRLPNGEYDKSFFSPDCFHPGRKGHAGFALGLWNIMLTKEKPYEISIEDTQDFRCPTEQEPYIFTRLNSDPSISIKAAVPDNESTTKVNNKLRVGLSVTVGLMGVALIAIAAVYAYKRQKQPKQTEKENNSKDNPVFQAA